MANRACHRGLRCRGKRFLSFLSSLIGSLGGARSVLQMVTERRSGRKMCRRKPISVLWSFLLSYKGKGSPLLGTSPPPALNGELTGRGKMHQSTERIFCTLQKRGPFSIRRRMQCENKSPPSPLLRRKCPLRVSPFNGPRLLATYPFLYLYVFSAREFRHSILRSSNRRSRRRRRPQIFPAVEENRDSPTSHI